MGIFLLKYVCKIGTLIIFYSVSVNRIYFLEVARLFKNHDYKYAIDRFSEGITKTARSTTYKYHYRWQKAIGKLR